MKWLLLRPQTLALWAYAVGFLMAVGEASSPLLKIGWNWALNWLVAEWVISDARRGKVRLWHDSGAFLFTAWPILAPIYLFKTRRLRGFIPIGCFIGIWLAAWAIATVLKLF